MDYRFSTSGGLQEQQERRQQQQGSHSPDSGTWVSFEDGLQHQQHPGLGPGEVHVSLPPPPRRGQELPSQPVHTSSMPGVMSYPAYISAQERQELTEIDRVQRILHTTDSPLDSVDVPETLDSHVTVRIDDRENGRVLSTLRPSNDTCAWIIPPVYHPEMVPQKVADLLQVPLEDYVMNLDMLVKDWRFRTYAVFYKRIIGIWLLITLIVLLSLLFSGLRGLSLFAAGLIWLIIAGSGMCMCLYGKKKISDGLRLAVAHANKFMVKQRLIVGVEDRGKLSLQKVVIPIIHYDVLPCLAVIAQLLEDSKIVRTQNGTAVNVYMPSQPNMDAQDTTPMDKAELLMLRCVQPYVKELVKKRLLFHVTKVEDVGVVTQPNSELPNLMPRHCGTSWCLCQFVDRMVIRRKPRKWFRKIWGEEL